MKIKLARTLGYCLGVRRAMDTAFAGLSRRGEKVFSHGQLIHNAQALDLLASKGLKLWSGEREGLVIIRAHGLPPEELARLHRLEAGGLKVRDATCPRVRRVQILVAREAARGREVIIWGQVDHPEVAGLVGHAGGRARVVAEAADVAGLPPADEVLLVSQTTQDLSRWPEVVDAVRARWPGALVKNTICQATEVRQEDLRRLSREVEALVIIGGKTSGNTNRLAAIGREMGRPTFLVETARDLNPDDFAGVSTVGVAAGASTSIWQIAQVLQALRALARSQSGFGFFWPRLLRALVLSNLFAALGLAALAQTAGVLMGFQPPAVLFSFFFFQVAALYLFHDFFQGLGASQSQALRVCDPDRTAFFAKYGRPLAIFTLIAALLAGLAAALAGPRALTVLAVSWSAALVHQFVPRPEGPASRARTLLGPPLRACGWGALMVWAERPEAFWAPPASGAALASAVFAAGAVFGQVFVLALMGDVLAVQSDRIFGRPTLPTVYGEQATRRLLAVFLAGWALWLALGWILGTFPALAIALIASGPAYNFGLLRSLLPEAQAGQGPGEGFNPALHGFHFEALLYGQLLLTGLLALGWIFW